MTYGSNCSNTKVSNHGPENWLRLPQDRKGRNLRSLGTGSGALVPRVTRDTHLDCVCRRFELAIRLPRKFGSGRGVGGSWELRGFRSKTDVLKSHGNECTAGCVGEGNSNLGDDLPRRWSLVERLFKGGIQVCDGFLENVGESFRQYVGPLPVPGPTDHARATSRSSRGQTPPCQAPPVPPRHSNDLQDISLQGSSRVGVWKQLRMDEAGASPPSVPVLYFCGSVFLQ